MKRVIRAKALTLGCLLVACSSVPMITDHDVLVSQNRGELLPLYEQMQADLATFEPGSEEAENRQLFLKKVGKKIAEEKERVLLNSLDRDFEKHDIATLQNALKRAEAIEPYNADVYQLLVADIEKVIASKQAIIADKEAEFERLDDKYSPDKVRLLDEIILIYGGEQGEQVALQKAAYIDGLFASAQEAVQTKRLDSAQLILTNLEEINPDYPGLEDLKHLLISSEYEQKFIDAVTEGNPDKIYFALKQLIQIPGYLQNNPDVTPIAEGLVVAFVAEGDKHMGTSSISSAYQAYSRARFIRVAMGQQDVFTPGEEKFIAYIDQRLTSYAESDQTVPAFGFLSILEELNPNHPSVAKFGQKINNAMLEEAIIKIVPSAFTEVQTTRTLGAGIVSKINQLLMEKVPTRVKIIEGSVVGTSFTGEQVAQKANPLSYYFLSGEILEASVEVVVKEANTTKRVLTSYQRIENPEYVAWTELSKREKKKVEQPEATIEVPVHEDVTIQKTITDKHGAFTMTYRLSESVSANVAFSDALTKKESHSGESVAGIELGLFIQEPQVAELPSDADILQSLADQIAEEVSGKIADQIIMLEEAYTEKAEQAVVAEDFNAATANFGYRVVLLLAQGKPSVELTESLRTYAIRWQNK